MKERYDLGLGCPCERLPSAIAEPDGEVRSLERLPIARSRVRKLVKKLGPVST